MDKLKTKKRLLVKKPATPKDVEFAQQEALVFLFICSRLDDKFQNNDSAQYIASAVTEGGERGRKIVDRALDRLVAKGCLRVVERGGRDSKGRTLQSVHGVVNPKPIWGNKSPLDRIGFLSKVREWSFVQGQNGAQVPEEPTTSPSEKTAICPRLKPLDMSPNNTGCNSSTALTVDVGCKTADVSTVGACPRRTPEKIAAQLKEERDELVFHERSKNSKRIRACRERIAKLEAELEGR